MADGWLDARFGAWVVRTPIANVAGGEIIGPYRFWKVAGPAHLSVRDLGLTFGTNTARGICIRFVEPVSGIDPLGAVRHPSLTVTVQDPESLLSALVESAPAGEPAGPPAPVLPIRQRLTQGAVAGVVATAAMSAAMVASRRLGLVKKTAPRVITESSVMAQSAFEPLTKTATAAAHIGFGAASGAVFGVVNRRLPGPRLLRGIIFAALIMVLSYQGWVPMATALPPLDDQTAGRRASLLISHVVYGVVLGRLTQ
jgi:hypothetical protein